jgi:hypothetical protein
VLFVEDSDMPYAFDDWQLEVTHRVASKEFKGENIFNPTEA